MCRVGGGEGGRSRIFARIGISWHNSNDRILPKLKAAQLALFQESVQKYQGECVGGWVHVPVVLAARQQDKAVGV